MNILLVEDEFMLADMISRGLKAEGWELTHAASAEQAVILLEGHSYDVMVLDRTLPGMSGTELCELLRAKQNYIPVLLLTALGEVGDRISGLGSGADDYLSKPFDFEELIARIAALGRRATQYSQAQETEHLQLGCIDFNQDSLQVMLNGVPLELTAKERELLLFFMKHPNKAFSREEILDYVWGENADPFSNIVDVYIGKLRRKVGQVDVQFDTVRGAGYRLTYLD